MSSLDDLKKRLYKPKESFKERERKVFSLKLENNNTPSEWEHLDFNSSEEVMNVSKEMLAKIKQKKRKRNIIVFVVSFLIILTAAGLFAYDFYIKGGGLGFISMENIEIRMEAPNTASAGDRFFLPVIFKNNNKIDLEDASITIDYPKGSEPLNKMDIFSLKEKRKVGLIPAGAETREDFEVFLYGEENSEHNFKITVEYRLKDSSAIFEKTAEKKVVISKSALSVFIESPSEANEGKELNFKIDVISNSAGFLKNMAVDIEYPPGFEFLEANPAPQKGTTRWQIGDIMNGEKKTISIKGKAPKSNFYPEGNIVVSAGSLNEDGDMIIYSKKSSILSIKKSLLSVELKIKEKSNEINVLSGENLEVELEWENNLPVGINNAVLEAKIKEGENVLDMSSMEIKDGNFRSFDNIIVFDSSTFPKFSYLESGEKGTLNFLVRIKKNLPIKKDTDKNFKIVFYGKFFTNHVPEGYKNIEITGESEIAAKIVSNFQFSQKGYYSLGHFKNSGPIPPKVGKETTYTIKWSLVNFSNDAADISVSAILPNYVKWQSNAFSDSKLGNISYNEETREVKWMLSNLKAGTGVVSPAEEISFQLLFLPAEAHLGSSQILISKAESSAKDVFTGVSLKDSEPAVTTELSSDPQAGFGKGTVVR